MKPTRIMSHIQTEWAWMRTPEVDQNHWQVVHILNQKTGLIQSSNGICQKAPFRAEFLPIPYPEY